MKHTYIVRGGIEQRQSDGHWRSVHLTEVTVEAWGTVDALAEAQAQVERHPLFTDYNRDFTRAFALVIAEI